MRGGRRASLSGNVPERQDRPDDLSRRVDGPPSPVSLLANRPAGDIVGCRVGGGRSTDLLIMARMIVIASDAKQSRATPSVPWIASPTARNDRHPVWPSAKESRLAATATRRSQRSLCA